MPNSDQPSSFTSRGANARRQEFVSIPQFLKQLEKNREGVLLLVNDLVKLKKTNPPLSLSAELLLTENKLWEVVKQSELGGMDRAHFFFELYRNSPQEEHEDTDEMSNLERENAKLRERVAELTGDVDDLKEQVNAPKVALETLQDCERRIQIQRDRAELILRESDQILSRITGKSKWSVSPLLKILVAVLSSVVLAVVLTVVIHKTGTSTEFGVTYDIGKMTEAMLVGAGALIASIAYALKSTNGD